MDNNTKTGSLVPQTKKEETKITWNDVYKGIEKNLNGEYSAEDLKTMRDNIAKNTTPSEFKLFLNTSIGAGLNPFNKEIWCYKDNKNNLLIFAGRDGFLRKAQENPSFNGIRSSEVKVNDDFSIDIANNKIQHTIKDPKNRGDIVGAYAIVFRKDGEPTVVFVEFSRYDKSKLGFGPWKTHPEDMIKKVAESKALKLAFGISGVQIEEEFDIKNGVAVPIGEPEILPTRKLNDAEFNKFISQTDEYIEKYKDRIEFTPDQQAKLDARLQ